MPIKGVNFTVLRRKTVLNIAYNSAFMVASMGQTYPVYRPRVTLLTQVVLHLSLQPHAVKVLPHLESQKHLLYHVKAKNG